MPGLGPQKPRPVQAPAPGKAGFGAAVPWTAPFHQQAGAAPGAPGQGSVLFAPLATRRA